MDLRRDFNMQSAPVQIISLTGAAFAIIMLSGIFAQMLGHHADFRNFMFWFELPTDPLVLLYRPWTLLTHVLVQYPQDFFSFLFRMLVLYQLGMLLLNFRNAATLWHLFIFGSISGALLHVITYALISLYSTRNGFLHGSAPAVLAVVAACGTLLPDFKVRLFLFGEVALKWIAIVYIAIDFVTLPLTGIDHMFHLGGAFYGFLYMRLYRTGLDLAKPWQNLAGRLKQYRQKPVKTQTKYTSTGPVSEEELDALLEKVSRKGYASLSRSEKERLEMASRQSK